ncbi:Endoribonuclease L-PSP-domain-containing protein [Durotheca rogersii]|uniref:Endoribonuclease L-PSP-domain-containing protein n=1 Tax=Durotheca rogersii TaxID=419775 RepID=UPI00221F4222|nr:Endoribonuclease L-PSP-domain-containing protein [Durotheca rogersii]KAI5862160.1 Endoribonuclease L-PSP-domain-containing protein [Durotheca rogersii]
MSLCALPVRALISSTVRRRFLPASRAAPLVPVTPIHHIRAMADITPVFSKEAAPPAGPYSHAIKTPTAIYCSGQIPSDADGNLVQGSIGDKTAACLRNLKGVLAAAGSSLDRVVKVNIFLTDMEYFGEMNQTYEKWFVSHKPARSCVAVKQLPKGVEIEIECIALP